MRVLPRCGLEGNMVSNDLAQFIVQDDVVTTVSVTKFSSVRGDFGGLWLPIDYDELRISSGLNRSLAKVVVTPSAGVLGCVFYETGVSVWIGSRYLGVLS
jgi:hypothetical protein